ncbi:hypothetical protein EON64_03440 [archaeon]|nr:MAG: hypothetical protein EON64_03440 [archaeon]
MNTWVDRYEGQWLGGKKHGKGKCFWGYRRGDRLFFKGQWRDGFRGRGTYYDHSGTAEQEHWRAEIVYRLSGCSCLYAGDRHRGILHLGSPSAQQAWTYAGELGSRREACGQGVLRCPLFVYEGAFEASKAAGQGKVTYLFEGRTVDCYEGAFRGDLPHGQGVLIFSCKGSGGTRVAFEGVFANGCREGEGRLLCSEGHELTGRWHKGVLQDGYVSQRNPSAPYESSWWAPYARDASVAVRFRFSCDWVWRGFGWIWTRTMDKEGFHWVETCKFHDHQSRWLQLPDAIRESDIKSIGRVEGFTFYKVRVELSESEGPMIPPVTILFENHLQLIFR